MTIAIYVAVFLVGVWVAWCRERTIKRLRRERDAVIFALRLRIAQEAGRQYVHDLVADFQRHVELDGIELEDGQAAAHAFADFLANQTGQTIVAQQLDGDGIIVAIPDDQEAT